MKDRICGRDNNRPQSTEPLSNSQTEQPHEVPDNCIIAK